MTADQKTIFLIGLSKKISLPAWSYLIEILCSEKRIRRITPLGCLIEKRYGKQANKQKKLSFSYVQVLSLFRKGLQKNISNLISMPFHRDTIEAYTDGAIDWIFLQLAVFKCCDFVLLLFQLFIIEFADGCEAF